MRDSLKRTRTDAQLGGADLAKAKLFNANLTGAQAGQGEPDGRVAWLSEPDKRLWVRLSCRDWVSCEVGWSGAWWVRIVFLVRG
jgi:hypothetical protein